MGIIPTNATENNRVATLSRVSTERSTQEMSIENQGLLFDEYCKTNQLTIVERYVEKGSGVKLNRSVIKQIKGDIVARKFDILLIKDLSRLARNIQVAHEIINLANEYRVKILTPNPTLNQQLGETLSTPTVTLLCMLSQMESESSSSRIKSTIHYNQRQGKVHASTPPYGYFVEDGCFHIRKDETVDVVKMIFTMYLEGKGIDSIAKQLNEKGILTPSQVLGKKNKSTLWGGSTIKGILTNRVYIGELVRGKSETITVTSDKREFKSKDEYCVFPNHHEAIIDKNLFDSVQSLMLSRRKKMPKVQKHLFTNIVFCEGCGRSLWFRANKSGGNYYCGSRSKYGVRGCSAPASIREVQLLNMLRTEFIYFMNEIKSNDYWRGIKQNFEKCQAASLVRVEDIEMKISKEKKSLLNLSMLLAKEVIAEDDYKETATAIKKSISDLELQLEEIRSHESEKIELKSIDEMKEKFLNFSLMSQDNSTITILRFVERIVVNEEKDMVVSYRFGY